MINFSELKRFKNHDKIKYGDAAAKLLDELMSHEINGYCFKYPRKKAAGMLEMTVKDFENLVCYLQEVGAVCAAGNAIISNPHRTRLKKLK